jgi:hypothetical protein
VFLLSRGSPSAPLPLAQNRGRAKLDSFVFAVKYPSLQGTSHHLPSLPSVLRVSVVAYIRILCVGLILLVQKYDMTGFSTQPIVFLCKCLDWHHSSEI